MTVFRINKNRDYTVMSNFHLRDKRLSLKAKGLLSFMFTLPDNWDYSLNGLVAICKENRDAIRSTLNELKFFKYLKIEPSRGDSGKFEYVYTIYEEPFDMPPKNKNLPYTENPYTVEPKPENSTQINTNNKIDKNDKTNSHNFLTNELINQKYIDVDDANLFCYDNLFETYLSEGRTYRELVSAIHYIVPRVLEREFLDEDGNLISNKYGYLKNSIESNFRKLESLNDNYYSYGDDNFYDRDIFEEGGR